MAGKSVTRKLIDAHIVEGGWAPGKEIGIRIDQTLTQDATGTLAYIEFASLGCDAVRTELSASYVDHNLLQTDYKNADDHRFLMTSAMRYGVWFSPPGNGVSHPVHMERFGRPGGTLLGSDSHTSTAGALGMLAIGAGGLDVAAAMAGLPFFMKTPEVFGVRLVGRLMPWVSAKDVILEMLRRHTVKGGLGRVIEYFGPGLDGLSATDRATIANMGAELGATTTVFPSDERTREFLRRHGREGGFERIEADVDARYDVMDEIDLTKLEPLIACPSSPDNVRKVSEVEGIEAAQVIVGSSVNFSFRDLMITALAVRDGGIRPGLSLDINPASRSVLEAVEAAGGTLMLTHAGARIHQAGCLGCIGMGQAPATGTVSVRTFPRNFQGRSGTEDDRVYLSSPETAAATAVFGKITDPRRLGECPVITEPAGYPHNERLLIAPLEPEERRKVTVVGGPNISGFPAFDGLPDEYDAVVLLKTGDNVTTDHILPGGNDVLPLRSNIPAISEHAFERLDRTFAARARSAGGGIVIGGENYGQGSSREHAAIAPRFLGVRVVVAKGFARIHRGNLINFGILPLTFKDPADYDILGAGGRLAFKGLKKAVSGAEEIWADREGGRVRLCIELSDREREYVLAGGLLNRIRETVT